MTIKKGPGGWLVDVQPGGRGGKRYRKTFDTQAEAKAYETWLRSKVNASAEWRQVGRDTRRLSELVGLWHIHHGVGLRAGEDTYRRLKAMVISMGDPVADRFNAEQFASYRAERIASGVTANAVNREHAYLRAMFNELSRLGHWTRDNPLQRMRAFKTVERELTYLSSSEIVRLLTALAEARNKHVLLIAKICLATGARWSEAEELCIKQVRGGVIQFAKTKSGKVRVVPIEDGLEQALQQHHAMHGTGDRLFQYAWSAFREGIERADIKLPDGQMTHALRHTFASHFIMNGGNILVLQRILGHQSLTMTMRYAHLAPDHLIEARQLNPLAGLHLAVA